MEQASIITEWDSYLGDISGSLQDVYISIWSFISKKEKDTQFNYFYSFLQDVDHSRLKIDPSAAPSDTPNAAVSVPFALQARDRIVPVLIQNDVSIEEFYGTLWTKINDPLLFPDEQSKSDFLFFLSIDARIPYYQLGLGMKMQDDEFASITGSIASILKVARSVVFKGLPQRTQEASLLMKLAEGINDQRTQTVFWAVVISYIHNRENMSAVLRGN